MTIDLNINPYFEDFDEEKNFHQILFKPSFAVQARELTQIQSIFQDQIKKFGNHVFKQGSIVIPGNVFGDLNIPYIRIDNFSSVVDIELKGTMLFGVNNSIQAIVKETLIHNNQLYIYLAYTSGGGPTGINTFSIGESAALADSNIVLTINQIGSGSLAYINKGVYYVNGKFVFVPSQSMVIDPISDTPSCHVLLKITESIADSTDDESLLDPSQGSYNFAAPGADRLRVTLTLSSLDLNSPINDDYIELMRYNNGVLEKHTRNSQYSELDYNLARRSRDVAGDYVVSGFSPSVVEHKKTNHNDGMYADGDITKFVMTIDAGKAYIDGFESESIYRQAIVMDKAREASARTFTTQPTFGQYIYITNVRGLPNFNQREIINIFTALTGGVSIGSIRPIAIDFFSGDPTSQDAIYKLYFHDQNIIDGQRIRNGASIRFGASGSAKLLHQMTLRNLTGDLTINEIISTTINRSAKIHLFNKNQSSVFVYRHSTQSVPEAGDFISGSSVNKHTATISSLSSIQTSGSIPLFKIDTNAIKSLRELNPDGTDGSFNISYTSWKYVMIVSGTTSTSLTEGEFRFPDVGITVASGVNSGIYNPSNFRLSGPSVLQYAPGGILTAAPENIHILTQVVKTSIPKIKTLTTTTISNIVPGNVISLGKTDIYRLVSIIDNNGRNVTRSYRLDNGQRDYFYDRGRLILTGSLPSSNLTITFSYFEHIGSGDFFAVDSYKTTLGEQFIQLIPNYQSITGSVYDLKNYIDFRPSVNDSGNFQTGSSLSDFPVIESLFRTTIQSFLPRIDTIVLDKNGTIGVIRGQSSETPRIPIFNVGNIDLYNVFVPAYTETVDGVVIKTAKNRRYTMRDINRLVSRIENIEQFSTLNALENNLLAYEIVDAVTGLNRFKTGFIVDNFSNPFTICDFFNPDNTTDFIQSQLLPKLETFDSQIHLVTTTGFTWTNETQISLPYTEVSAIKQNTSSKINNVNPFLIFEWEGQMTISPREDRWTQTNFMSPISETINISRSQVIDEHITVRPGDPRIINAHSVIFA